MLPSTPPCPMKKVTPCCMRPNSSTRRLRWPCTRRQPVESARNSREPSFIAPKRPSSGRARPLRSRFNDAETCQDTVPGRDSYAARRRLPQKNSCARTHACSNATRATHSATPFPFMKRITQSDLIEAAEAGPWLTDRSADAPLDPASRRSQFPPTPRERQ